MSRVNLFTRVVSSGGKVSQYKNTRRIWVGAGDIDAPYDTTGSAGAFVKIRRETSIWTWSDPSLAIGQDTAFFVSLPVEFSDLAVEGGGSAVDRGVRVMGFEVIYDLSTTLTDVNIELHKITLNDHGTIPSAASVPFTFDAEHDSTAERADADEHRMECSIAARDRFFLDGGSTLQLWVEFEGDGSGTPQVDFYGVMWHLERTEE